MFDDDAFSALRRMNPRHSEGFEESVRSHEQAAAEIMAETSAEPLSEEAAVRPRRHTPTARPRRRVFGLSAAGFAVVAACVIAGAVLLAGGETVVPPANAAEAVKKAAADTSAAARSGVIKSRFSYQFDSGSGDSALNTFSWNGDDVSLMAQDDPQRQIRYVDGKYYQTYGYNIGLEDGEHLDEWLRCTDYDEGGPAEVNRDSAIETSNPVEWLIAARTDLAGDGLVELVAGGEDYTQTENEDGSITYAGTLTVGGLQSRDFGVFGLPEASKPGFKVDDPEAPVSVQVTVGADGLIREFKLDWGLDRPGEVVDFHYVATYEQLGSAPEIAPPDPERTVTTDNPFPKEEPGEM